MLVEMCLAPLILSFGMYMQNRCLSNYAQRSASFVTELKLSLVLA